MPKETVTINGSLSFSFDICSYSEAELAAFIEANVATIEDLACTVPNSQDTVSVCMAEIVSICGRQQRKLLQSSRELQSSTWQLEYRVIETFTCAVVGCDSPADIAAVASISEAISANIESSMENGSFLSVLSTNIVPTSGLDASIVNCLTVWGNIEDPETEVHAEQGTGLYYPDWKYGSCLEDGNQPTYMDNYPETWISDSLDQCCARFFPLNYQCLNLQGSGLWYADVINKVCVTDCESGRGKTCGGLANVGTDKIYANPRSCCESELGWLFVEFCEVGSLILTINVCYTFSETLPCINYSPG